MSETTRNALTIAPREDYHSAWADKNIESGQTIIQQRGLLISIDALTQEGWLRFLGVECDEDVRERMIDTLKLTEFQWREPKNTSLVFPATGFIETHSMKDHLQDRGWVESSEEILARLEDPNANEDDFNETVLVAEITEFEPDGIPRLLDSLGEFISKKRCSNRETTILSLGAAIRKFAMNMSEDRFDKYASWLSPGETTYLDHRVELELVQGISWRLTYVPVSLSSVPNRLIETLQEIANQYTSPRFIVQKNYAATALVAVVALVSLRILTDCTSEAEKLLETVCKLERDWFQELVTDELQEIAAHVSRHDQSLSDAISRVLAAVV